MIRDAQLRGCACPTVPPDNDVHVLAERHKESQETLHRKLAEIPPQHLRNVGLLHPEEFRRRRLFQAARLHQAIDLVNELGLHQVLLRIGQADIGKHVAAAALVVARFRHPCSPNLSPILANRL